MRTEGLFAAATLVTLSILCLQSVAPRAASAATPMQKITPAYSDEVLNNPGMGIYCFLTGNEAELPVNAWFYPLVQIGYHRADWASLQNAGDGEGHYRFDEKLKPLFDLWVTKWHKRIAFRFMSSNMHSQSEYVSPKWMFDAGVPYVVHKGLYVDRQVDPVFWDEKYLAAQDRFIAELGKYLDGKDGLEFIDIGGIGEWGEMHLSRWSTQELADTGFTPDRYIAAYRHMIDAYVKAFPHTRIFLNVGDYATINDYAAMRGVNFRQDGLNPQGASYDVGPRFYREYAKRGILCNYEMYAGYEEMQQRKWDLIKTFEKGLEDPISYWHINLLSYKQMLNPPDDYRQALKLLSAKLGYHLAISELEVNQQVGTGQGIPGRIVIRSTWQNRGIAAPAYSYAVQWMLKDATGKTVVETLTYPRTPTTRWWTDVPVTESALLRVPSDLPVGTYTLAARMINAEKPAQTIELAMKGRQTDGTYALASIEAKPGALAAARLPKLDLEKDVAGWVPVTGMTLTHASEGYNSAGSVKVAGRQPGKHWDYAYLPLGNALQPGARYRVTCWMKVADWSAKDIPPYVKLGLNDAKGVWITNVNSAKYDLQRQGQWQQLAIDCEMPPLAEQSIFAIERGEFDAEVSGTIWLDDLTVEMLEAP